MALTEAGIAIADVRELLLTHIHLDHAGAAGSLLRENPDIAVYVHERGAPAHDRPVEAARQRPRGSTATRWTRSGGRSCRCRRPTCGCSPAGNASRRRIASSTSPTRRGTPPHHVSFFDRDSGIAFVGDVAGVRTGRELFVLPPTPPARHRRRGLGAKHRARQAVARVDPARHPLRRAPRRECPPRRHADPPDHDDGHRAGVHHGRRRRCCPAEPLRRRDARLHAAAHSRRRGRSLRHRGAARSVLSRPRPLLAQARP